MIDSEKEGCVVLKENGERSVAIFGNGSVEYYKLIPMGLQDHEELWSADTIKVKND